MTTRASQASAIRSALLAGRALTPIDALNEFGCFRLGGRIYDLKREGLAIETEMVEVASGKRVAQYRLKQPVQGRLEVAS